MKLSKHAKKRIKQRHKNNNLFEDALESGYPASKFKGQFRRYLDGLMRKGKCNLRVYKNFVYIFNKDDVLVTTFSIPSKFHKITKKVDSNG